MIVMEEPSTPDGRGGPGNKSVTPKSQVVVPLCKANQQQITVAQRPKEIAFWASAGGEDLHSAFTEFIASFPDVDLPYPENDKYSCCFGLWCCLLVWCRGGHNENAFHAHCERWNTHFAKLGFETEMVFHDEETGSSCFGVRIRKLSGFEMAQARLAEAAAEVAADAKAVAAATVATEPATESATEPAVLP
jgi:hypothetical protein